MNRIPLALALGLLVASCGLLGSRNPDSLGSVEVETAEHHLELAQAELERGDHATSFDRLLAIRELDDLPPETRRRTETLLERATIGLLEDWEREGRDPDDLVDLSEEDLSASLRALVGVRAAELMLAEGDRVGAVDEVMRLEEALPLHVQRGRAARVLAEAGLSLIADDGRYRLIYRYRSKGIRALDFLVLNYPGDPACPEAYLRLGEAYEDRDELHDAIDRYADLALYHADSPFAVIGEARLPYLRLKRLERDDYDRGELVLAKKELESWLAKHAGTELEGWVRQVLEHCNGRLARSDLGLARYYETVGNALGQRLHAERALAEAHLAGDEDLAARATALVESAKDVERRDRHRAKEVPTWDDEDS